MQWLSGKKNSQESVKLRKLRGVKGTVFLFPSYPVVSFYFEIQLGVFKGGQVNLPENFLLGVEKFCTEVEMVENWKSVDCTVAGIMTSMSDYWVAKSHEILWRQESLDIIYAFILPQ